MSTTIKFLDSVIRNIKPCNTRQIYWCDGCPGFGLRVTPSGTKTFVFKYMSSRKSRWITIGKYPQTSIRHAHREYDVLYEQVHDFGRDVVAETKAEEEKRKSRYTVSEFIPMYIAYGRMKEKKSIAEEERVLKLDVLPVIGDMFIDEVISDDIEKIQTRILLRTKTTKNATKGGKVAIKNSLAYTRQLFNFAKKRKLISSNPVNEIESLGKSGSRSRILSFEEIWMFWNRIEHIGLPAITAKALKFTLVTMQRSIEVRNMRYAAYKADENVWQMEVYETKNRTMHRVPLNRHALELIDAVKPFTGASDFVFGSTRASIAPKHPSKDLSPMGKTAFPQAIRRSRDALSIEDFCPHDLRRTGATWITAVGLPKLYARLMLNHSDGERDVTGEVYVQYSYDFEKQRAAKVWEFVLDQIVNSPSIKGIPTLDVLRDRVRKSGLL